MSFCNGEIIDIDLSPILFELIENVSHESADDLATITAERHKRDEGRSAQKQSQIWIAGNGVLIRSYFVERVPEYFEEAFKKFDVLNCKPFVCVIHLLIVPNSFSDKKRARLAVVLV